MSGIDERPKWTPQSFTINVVCSQEKISPNSFMAHSTIPHKKKNTQWLLTRRVGLGFQASNASWIGPHDSFDSPNLQLKCKCKVEWERYLNYGPDKINQAQSKTISTQPIHTNKQEVRDRENERTLVRYFAFPWREIAKP